MDIGSGGINGEGRKAGLTIYGAETFYGGSNIRAEIERQGWLGTVVREIKNGIVPFENNFFDLIISNQVFEHIEDLDAVLREIERVLKPNGILLCLFPSKECIREGHCGIPFIHWFPKGSHFRFYYMVALRTLGLGHHKGKKSASQWANDFLQWLDAYTYYRDKNAVLSGFRTRFTVSFLEHEYITFRLDKYGRAFLSRIFQLHFVQWFGSKLFRRLACMVILAQKSQGMRLPVT
jgi:SAM-dependent methyltransferase